MESSRKYLKENSDEKQEASTSSAKSSQRPFDIIRQGHTQEQEDSSDKNQKASAFMDLTRQGNSDLGRENPEMQKRLNQMRSNIDNEIKHMKL